MTTTTARHGLRIDLLGWLLAGCLALGPCSAAATNAAGDAAPRLLLANQIGPHIDVRRYLVSEKLDGVRAYWDGSRLRFRSGRPIAAPAWFTARLPAQALDGELWLGRGRFDALSAIVRSEPADDDAWRRVRYMIFELPGASGDFTDRVRQIEQVVRRTGWAPLQAVKQQPIGSRAELQHMLDRITAGGGEGLMLHLASAAYTTGRSDVLIKLKPQLDSEAVVVGHRAGRGRHLGRLGALQLQMPDGRRFWLGTGFSDEDRRNPPPIGATVTFRYRDLTSQGLPRFASFVRVRETF